MHGRERARLLVPGMLCGILRDSRIASTVASGPAKPSSLSSCLSRSCPFHDFESLLSNPPRNERTAQDTENQSESGGELNGPIEPLAIHWLLGLNASQKEDCGCDY